VAAQAPQPEESADVILHPAAEVAAAEPAPVPAATVAVADTSESVREEAVTPRDEAALTYEPDQERRDKFFSRLSKWAKK
jgi:hypothetical protein